MTGADEPVAEERFRTSGTVKWFDVNRGFGFLLSAGGQEDILLHANVLRSYGQNSVPEGAVVEVIVQRTPRGLQATTVLSVGTVTENDSPPIEELGEIDRDELARLPFLPARVKWYDRLKGFGFANVFGNEQDVFLHAEVLRRAGFADLQPGEALAVRVIEGRRGKMAAQVVAWDAVLRLEPPAEA